MFVNLLQIQSGLKADNSDEDSDSEDNDDRNQGSDEGETEEYKMGVTSGSKLVDRMRKSKLQQKDNHEAVKADPLSPSPSTATSLGGWAGANGGFGGNSFMNPAMPFAMPAAFGGQPSGASAASTFPSFGSPATPNLTAPAGMFGGGNSFWNNTSSLPGASLGTSNNPFDNMSSTFMGGMSSTFTAPAQPAPEKSVPASPMVPAVPATLTPAVAVQPVMPSTPAPSTPSYRTGMNLVNVVSNTDVPSSSTGSALPVVNAASFPFPSFNSTTSAAPTFQLANSTGSSGLQESFQQQMNLASSSLLMPASPAALSTPVQSSFGDEDIHHQLAIDADNAHNDDVDHNDFDNGPDASDDEDGGSGSPMPRTTKPHPVIPRKEDWKYDPIEDNKPVSFFPGSRRDKDWKAEDERLIASLGEENSYGVPTIHKEEEESPDLPLKRPSLADDDRRHRYQHHEHAAEHKPFGVHYEPPAPGTPESIPHRSALSHSSHYNKKGKSMSKSDSKKSVQFGANEVVLFETIPEDDPTAPTPASSPVVPTLPLTTMTPSFGAPNNAFVAAAAVRSDDVRKELSGVATASETEEEKKLVTAIVGNHLLQPQDMTGKELQTLHTKFEQHHHQEHPIANLESAGQSSSTGNFVGFSAPAVASGFGGGHLSASYPGTGTDGSNNNNSNSSSFFPSLGTNPFGSAALTQNSSNNSGFAFGGANPGLQSSSQSNPFVQSNVLEAAMPTTAMITPQAPSAPKPDHHRPAPFLHTAVTPVSSVKQEFEETSAAKGDGVPASSTIAFSGFPVPSATQSWNPSSSPFNTNNAYSNLYTNNSTNDSITYNFGTEKVHNPAISTTLDTSSVQTPHLQLQLPRDVEVSDEQHQVSLLAQQDKTDKSFTAQNDNIQNVQTNVFNAEEVIAGPTLFGSSTLAPNGLNQSSQEQEGIGLTNSMRNESSGLTSANNAIPAESFVDGFPTSSAPAWSIPSNSNSAGFPSTGFGGFPTSNFGGAELNTPAVLTTPARSESPLNVPASSSISAASTNAIGGLGSNFGGFPASMNSFQAAPASSSTFGMSASMPSTFGGFPSNPSTAMMSSSYPATAPAFGGFGNNGDGTNNFATPSRLPAFGTQDTEQLNTTHNATSHLNRAESPRSQQADLSLNYSDMHETQSQSTDDAQYHQRGGPNWDLAFFRIANLDSLHDTLEAILRDDDLYEAAELYISTIGAYHNEHTDVARVDHMGEDEADAEDHEKELQSHDLAMKLQLLRGWRRYQVNKTDTEGLLMGLEEVIGLEQEEIADNLSDAVAHNEAKLEQIHRELAVAFVPDFILSSDFEAYFETHSAMKAHTKKLRIDSKVCAPVLQFRTVWFSLVSHVLVCVFL